MVGPNQVTVTPAADPPQANAVPIQVLFSNQYLLVLLDTGLEVNLISEATTKSCKLRLYPLMQSLRLSFVDGRQERQDSKYGCRMPTIQKWVTLQRHKTSMLNQLTMAKP